LPSVPPVFIAKFIDSSADTMKSAAVYLFAGIVFLALGSFVSGMENNIIISKGYVSKLCIDRCKSSVMTHLYFFEKKHFE
jgi:hypothetical protein